jgi:hypothetical protein
MRLVSARLVSACLFFASTLAVNAQNDRGTITGEVKDQGGAVIPSAPVIATNKGTGAVSKTTTTATGNYTIPSLAAGFYSITVEVKGFKKFVQENIEVQVATTNRVDIDLRLGPRRTQLLSRLRRRSLRRSRRSRALLSRRIGSMNCL